MKIQTIPLMIALSLSMASAELLKLQLDFGPTTVPSTPTDMRIVSPYHTESGSVADLTWNKVELADVASGLLYSNGSAATGVSLNLGVSPNSNIIDFAAAPSTSSALGSSINTGVFATGSVGRDGIFSGSGSENNRIGLQISGLAHGIYEVYIVGINTNQNQANWRAKGMGAIASTSMTTWDTSSVSGATTIGNHTDGSSPTAWIEGQNYAKFTMTLDATNPVLSLFTFSDIGSDNRGFLNSVQIVAIPEPGTLVLLGIAFGSLMLFRRRK